MTDLTYCYRHMTSYDIDALDEIETSDFETGNLSDEELEIPYEMIPPNPDDADTLPSQVHPSYPYGDPTRLTHPAALPRPPYDPTSRALFEDNLGGVNAALRWRDLALDLLLPVDPDKAEAARAALARKQASGTGNPQRAPAPAGGAGAQAIMEAEEEFEDEDEEDDEDDDDEGSEEEDGSEEDEDEDEEEEDYADHDEPPRLLASTYLPPGYVFTMPGGSVFSPPHQQ